MSGGDATGGRPGMVSDDARESSTDGGAATRSRPTVLSIGVGGTTTAARSGCRGAPVMSVAMGRGSRSSSVGQNAPTATAIAPRTAMIAARRRRRLGWPSVAAARTRAALGGGTGAGASGIGGGGGATSGTPGGVGNTVSPTGINAPTDAHRSKNPGVLGFATTTSSAPT